MMESRLLRAVLATLLGVASLVSLDAVLAPARACACGGVVDLRGGDTHVSGETALLTLRGGVETIAMTLDAQGDALRAGLIVPTPTPATASLGDGEVFSDLRRLTRPREVHERTFFAPPVLSDWLTGFGDPSDNVGAPPAAEVLRSVDLGPIVATTLAAEDAGALGRWMRRHQFEMPAQFPELMQPYVDQGWSYVAIELTAEGTALYGELPPVELSFASDELVYPMQMSRESNSVDVDIFVLGEEKVARTDPAADSVGPVYFADQVSAEDASALGLRDLIGGGAYLSYFQYQLSFPQEQAAADFTFGADPDSGSVIPTYVTTSGMVPVDLFVLAILAVLAKGVLLLVLLRWVRSRDRSGLAAR